MNSKLKMAIVGAGIWGENHAKIYQAHPFCEVVAVCDEKREKAQALAAKMKIPQWYDSYQEMFKGSGCDAVAIVTPDFAHAAAAIKAAEYGKHVLVEKPLATTREDVFAMTEAFEKNKVRAMVDLHNRWSPAFNVAHQSVERGELGVPCSGYMRLNDIKWVATDMLPWAAKSSILWFLGSHSLDTLRWFFDDEVKRVYSVSREGILKGCGVDTVDAYLTTLEFKKGGIAQMENGWITPNANPCVNDMKFSILGDKGMISLDMSNHNMIQKYTDEKVAIPDIVVQHSIFDYPKGFAFESIRSFVDCLLSGEPFHVSITDAANTSLAILAIMESAKTRLPVEVRY
ncbi:MAG: Gfo/Idh/MocA family oxidoreductase [Spirochaetaceae bacterium]|jgi:predicted dehydrogenase|nr:Gfo/Idh/MocA family oxidoreductase [Spirochaetaceae bacterium]